MAPSLAGFLALAFLYLAFPGLSRAQTADSLPRQLSPAVTGCTAPEQAPSDSTYDSQSVDQPVRARRLPIEDLPFRAGQVLTGHSILRFIVDGSGRIDRCSIAVVEETAAAWTDAVVRELRSAHYQPARRQAQPVRQWVYQKFTYHSDGRLLHSR